MTGSKKGLFIVFEGIDLSGKTTQAQLLGAWFLKRGEKALVTQEPSEKGLYGRHARMALQKRLLLIEDQADLLSEEIVRAYLFALDRFTHLKNEIEPHLANGIHVICDRYYLSSLTYQAVALARRGYAAMDSLERVWQLNADAIYAATQPDLTVLIDIPVHVWTQRRQNRFGAKGLQVEEIYEGEERRQELRDAYDRAIHRLRATRPNLRIETITCQDSAQSPAELGREVVRLVESCRI